MEVLLGALDLRGITMHGGFGEEPEGPGLPASLAPSPGLIERPLRDLRCVGILPGEEGRLAQKQQRKGEWGGTTERGGLDAFLEQGLPLGDPPLKHACVTQRGEQLRQQRWHLHCPTEREAWLEEPDGGGQLSRAKGEVPGREAGHREAVRVVSRLGNVDRFLPADRALRKASKLSK